MRPLTALLSCALVAMAIMWLAPADVPEPDPDSATARVTLLVELPAGTAEGSEESQAVLARSALYLTSGEIPRRAAEALSYEGDPARLSEQLTVVQDPVAVALILTSTQPDASWALDVVNAFATEGVRGLGDARTGAGSAPVSVVEGVRVLPPTQGGGYVRPPGRGVRVAIGGALGLLIGLGVALVAGRLGGTLRSRDQVAAALRMPVLAEVQRYGGRRHRGGGITVVESPLGAAADAFRGARSALDHTPTSQDLPRRAHALGAGPDPTGRVVLVTSPYRRDGRTSVAANLAAAWAESGRSVLVLDADLRAPRSHEVLGVPLVAGLADLDDRVGPSELSQRARPTLVDGVSLVTAGPRMDRPATVSTRPGPLVAAARQVADVIVIDGPPLLDESDGHALLSVADDVVVVVRAGRLSTSEAPRVADLLARFGSKATGAVLVGSGASRPAALRPTLWPAWSIVGGLVLVVAYASGLAWAMNHASYNLWGAMVVVPVVLAANALLIARAASVERDRWLTRVLVAGYLAKMAGALARYAVAYFVYDGAADAVRYNAYASAYYELWRQGVVQWEWGGRQGTQYMELITTAVYVVTGPSPLTGFVVFSSAAFWGAYLLYRAFRIAVPDGDHRRYALLLFLLPSMVYWPSSIGKEAWLLLFVGVVALGAARWFAGRSGAVPLLVVGAAGTALVRPHVAVLLFGALAVAQLVRPAGRHATSVLTKALGLVVVAGAVVVLASQSASVLGIDDLSLRSVNEGVEAASSQASQGGGSAFTPVPLASPVGLPAAVVTVLFRPFPWEAGNAQMAVQSLEGLLLLALLVRSRGRLRALPSTMRRSPYVAFALSYVLAFVIAFAGFGNFGILARQRVLMLPFFLVLLALPVRSGAGPVDRGGGRAGALQLRDRDPRRDGREEGGGVGGDDDAPVVAAHEGEREHDRAPLGDQDRKGRARVARDAQGAVREDVPGDGHVRDLEC